MNWDSRRTDETNRGWQPHIQSGEVRVEEMIEQTLRPLKISPLSSHSERRPKITMAAIARKRVSRRDQEISWLAPARHGVWKCGIEDPPHLLRLGQPTPSKPFKTIMRLLVEAFEFFDELECLL